MNIPKTWVVLLALLLVGMAMVPIVSAGEIVSSEKILSMKYFQDSPREITISPQSLMIGTKDTEQIAKYSLVTVDSKAFINDAETTKKVIGIIGSKQYTIELTPANLIAPDAKLYIKTENGTTITNLPHIKQYRGRVLGTGNGNALFIVDDNVILGHISIDNNTYLLDQYGTQSDGKSVQIVYNARDEIVPNNRPLPNGDDIYLPPLDSSKKLTSADMNKIKQTSTQATTTSTVRILAVYDAQFHNIYPSTSSAQVTSIIASASNAFSPSYIGVNFQIAGIASDSTLTSTNKDTLLTQLQASESSIRDSTSSDLVFLFTGRDLDGDYIGNSVLYSGGVQDLSAYGLAQMTDSGTSYTGSAYQRPIAVAHELGHNFGAMHQTLYPGTDVYPYYVPTYARAYSWTSGGIARFTALYSPFQTGTSMSLEFSSPSGHGSSSQDNARRISETKAAVAAYR